MPRYEHTVMPAEQGMRIDALLATFSEIQSRGEAVRLIEGGQVVLNGTRHTAKKRIVLVGDLIQYHISPPQPKQIAAECIKLDIRYEDEYLIVLSKEAGMVVHPAQGHEEGTLANALMNHCGYENLAFLQGEDRPGIVHRLDKDTSGLMLAAKDEQAGMALQEEIKTRNIGRRYLALVHGYITPQTGLIDAPITRGSIERKRMVIGKGKHAREAITSFLVFNRFEATMHDDGYTYIECKLYTGRTHQIRVHMDYIGHPCVGDPLYGRLGTAAQLGLERQFLHSYKLSFVHPITGVSMEFKDGLPSDLSKALDSLESRKIE